ncbi:hypothetical protein BsWGS_24135 [Bradybaena similaris]
MTEKFAQRICINFCQKLGDTFTETYEGRENVESDHRSGRHVTSRSEKHIADVSSTVRENRRITIRELSEEHSISFGSVQAILTEDLGMRRVSAKFVPKLLSADQKDNRVSGQLNQFLAKHKIPQVRQPPYSPDLAPCDFFLFPKIKSHLKGRRFQDVGEIKENATRQLHTISEDEFQECFRQWKQRWIKCVASEGDYFEGD